jgi:hypothetical protein
LAPSHVEVLAIIAKILFRRFDFCQISADFLAVFFDLCFAGALEDIAAQFGAIVSQLRMILAQLFAALLHFLARIPDGLGVISSYDWSVDAGAVIERAVFSNVDYLGLAVPMISDAGMIMGVTVVIAPVAVMMVVMTVVNTLIAMMMVMVAITAWGWRTMGMGPPSAMLVVAIIMLAFALVVIIIVVIGCGCRNQTGKAQHTGK